MSRTYGSEGSVDSEFSFQSLDCIVEYFTDPDDPRTLRFVHLLVPAYLREMCCFEA